MDLYSASIMLFLVKDPIGNIPIFLSLLGGFTPKRRCWIIIRENLISLFILTLFLFGGKGILSGLHITQQALSLSGGVVLFTIAFKMAFPSEVDVLKKERQKEEPFIVPLATPLLAGPSSIATMTVLANQYPNDLLSCFLALAIVTVLSTLILLGSVPLQKLLGEKLLKAFERLMGIMLITMAIQMLLDGLRM